jgi:putative DNA primase/helicase
MVTAANAARHGHSEETFCPKCLEEHGYEILTEAEVEKLSVPERVQLNLDAPYYEHTDIGNARMFAKWYENRFRYVSAKHQWLTWHGHRWHPDNGDLATRAAQILMRDATGWAQKIPNDKGRTAATKWYGVNSQNAARLHAMVELARVLEPILDDGTGWDENPDLIGCQNGVIEFDPITGDATFRAGRPNDRITQSVAVDYVPDAKCPTWLRFLNDVHPKEDVRAWHTKALGYSITGHTREQVSFWAHGGGANGKGTENETIVFVMGDYAHVMPYATLIGRRAKEATNDLAGLVGKRYTACSEVPKDAHTNEQRLKGLTGEDSITVRFLYGEFFTFKPRVKLWFAVNDKPTSRDNSEGYWRRIRLIEYNQRFDVDTDPPRDNDIRQKLKAEAEGIFAWLVRRASAWYREGLGDVPEDVVNATKAYREENDPLQGFIKAAAIVAPNVSVVSSTFYAAFAEWCRTGDIEEDDIPSHRAVTLALKALGIEVKPTKSHNLYVGIGLLTEEQQFELGIVDEDMVAA